MDFDFSNDTIVATGPSGVLNISSMGGILLPIGTTAERPSIPVNGMLRYNSSLNALDLYINNQWQYVVPSPTAGTVIMQDVIANRPAASSGNLIFIAVDINKMYRDTGTSWVEIGSLGTVNSVTTTQPAEGLTISGGPITTSGTLVFSLSNDLGAIESLNTNGILTRIGTDTWAARTITSGSSKLSISNGNGVSGNPAIDVVESNLTLNNIGGTLAVTKGGTNLSSIGTANQILGVNSGATSLEYKTLTAGSGVSIVHSVGGITITNTATGGAPGGANTNVQYNNSGSFGGSNAFNFIAGANPRVDILGTALTTQLTIGGQTDPNNALLYIETNGDNTNEGLRCYFKRSTVDVSAYITFVYDGAAPNIRLTDIDDDPAHIQFNCIGTGTYAAPQYNNIFGARGDQAAVTTGFAWRINQNTVDGYSSPVMELDSQWLRQPIGTTAQRPGTPTQGMSRFNTTLGAEETYRGTVWISPVGIINKSVVTQTVTTTGPTNIVSFNVPGGTLGDSRLLRIRLAGTWNNASASSRTVTVTISYGGTTMYSDTSASIAALTTVGWNMDLILLANNSTLAQQLTGMINIGSTGAVSTGLTGDLGTDEIVGNSVIAGSAAINSASNQTLNIGIGFNGSTITWNKFFHTIEIM